MAKSEILTGLDLGSGKVTCIIAERDEEKNKVRVLGGASADCKGLKTGMAINIEEVTRSVSVAVEAAESRSGQVASDVLLGIRGPHLYSLEGHGRLNIARTDQEITAEDVSNVIENGKAFSLEHGMEIVHVVPQKFSLDRLQGVPNPIGMQGALLEVRTHMVLGQSPVISNLVKAVSTAGFKLADNPIYTLLALGELVVSEEEKALGTLLMDIGGQTTSLAIYVDGSIHFSKELTIGGDSISKDIAHGLGTTAGWARELKEKYGVCFTAMADKEKRITIMKADRRTKAEITNKDLLPFIQPRLEEIFELAFEAVQKSQYTDLSGGVILSGGGSLLKGMPEAAAELLELTQSHLAYPVHDLLVCPEEYLSQPYLGAVALTCYPYLKTWDTDLPGPGRGSGAFKRIWQQLADLF